VADLSRALSLLEKDPETFRPLVAHESIRPYLDALMGPQCQLRSFRAHINPGAYEQEWHMDFYGYWRQPKRRRLRMPSCRPDLTIAVFKAVTAPENWENGASVTYWNIARQDNKYCSAMQ
jgi:ectoine hydroxylase-related dioxygenase (phytanoyl-CoA dioxygenase family)